MVLCHMYKNNDVCKNSEYYIYIIEPHSLKIGFEPLSEIHILIKKWSNFCQTWIEPHPKIHFVK